MIYLFDIHIPYDPNSLIISPAWIIPAVMGAVSLVNSIIAARQAKKQNKQTNEANMALAQYQTTTNEQLIDKQNAYNTPSAQMARYSAANLNPNLIYGQGSPGNQSSPATYQRPEINMRYSPFQIPEVLGQYQDYSMKQAQIENIEANTAKTEEQTLTEPMKRLVQEILGKQKGLDFETSDVLKYHTRTQGRLKTADLQQSVLNKWEEFSNIGRRGKLLDMQNKSYEIQNEKNKMELLFMQYREQFEKMGINSSDHFTIRMLIRMLTRSGFELN